MNNVNFHTFHDAKRPTRRSYRIKRYADGHYACLPLLLGDAQRETYKRCKLSSIALVTGLSESKIRKVTTTGWFS